MKISVCVVLVIIAQACCQREKLAAHLKDVAKSVHEIIPDNPTGSTSVKVNLHLLNIVDYNPKNQVMDLTAWLSFDWNDARFAWDPENYGGISKSNIPAAYIKQPDFKLYNGARHGMTIDADINCVIFSTGNILCIPLVDIESFCPITNPTAATFNCSIKLGSWAYSCNQLNITRAESYVDVTDFQGGWRWQIVESSSNVIEKQYPCCPELYCSVDIVLKIQDKSRTPLGKWYFQ